MKRFGYIYAPRVRGNLNLGPGHWLVAPAGIIGAFNTMGNVFFTDWWLGDDINYDGTLPALEAGTNHGPFKTVAHALTQCAHDHDDYIIIVDQWGEATPVAVSVTGVHIIGLSSNPSRLWPVWPVNDVTGDTAILTISSPSNMCEIAGLDFGGGAAHAAIENIAGTPMGVYIHHNMFGSFWTGDAPQDAIRISVNATALRVEANKFLGTSIHAKGALTRDAIHFAAAAISYGGDLVDNIFQGIPGIAINILTHGEALVIKRNEFTVPDLADGEAITLAGATVAGVMVDDNAAMNGNAQGDYAQNPFRDLNAPNNHWGRNYRGNAVIEPIIT